MHLLLKPCFKKSYNCKILNKCSSVIMKYYKFIGISACVLIVVSCFLPWTYYADLNKSFTGFFTEQNIYGKPGKVFVFFAVCSAVLILLNKIWAKRTLIFFAALNIGYLIKTYVLFTTCYSTICPVKLFGFYLLMFSCIVLVITSVLPNLKLEEKVEEE